MSDAHGGWVGLAATLLADQSLLYLGPRDEPGLDHLRDAARAMTEFDGARPFEPDRLKDYESDAFDAVVALAGAVRCDGVSEIANDLCRIAKHAVFVTAPNAVLFRNPRYDGHGGDRLRAFYERWAKLDRPRVYKGTPDGSVILPVRHIGFYLMLHDFLNNEISHYPTRAFESLLPQRARSYGFTAALVRLSPKS